MMRKLTHYSAITALLLVAIVIIGGCKKKTEDPVPTFTMQVDSVPVTGGGKGLQFFAKCTNNDVAMTNASITDPASGVSLRNYLGASFAKNALIPMQGTDTAYVKIAGTWRFTLVGKSSGGTTFAFDATVAVSK
jgi:hypothetical protein